MIESFEEILKLAGDRKKRKVAVAAAQDEPVLQAVKDAVDRGIVDAVLVGDGKSIEDIAKNVNLNLSGIEIIDERDTAKACMAAVSLVSGKKADMVMKGLVDTATFLRAVLDKERGLRTGKLLSHVAVFEVPALKRLIILTDAAMNIAPDLAAKKQILENAVSAAHAIGIKVPKVAPICAVEVVNPDMQCTVDAAILSKMNDRGQIRGCIVDGPLALDNAISEEAARHKGIQSPVAGHADIILVPNIETGNAVYKTLTYTAGARAGSMLSGALAPVILTSRADSPESKLYSIALASLAVADTL
jgi:phosphate butyryltransferase